MRTWIKNMYARTFKPTVDLIGRTNSWIVLAVLFFFNLIGIKATTIVFASLIGLLGLLMLIDQIRIWCGFKK